MVFNPEVLTDRGLGCQTCIDHFKTLSPKELESIFVRRCDWGRGEVVRNTGLTGTYVAHWGSRS